MHRLHAGRAEAAPVFRFQQSWYEAGVTIEQTRLRVEQTAHLSFPLPKWMGRMVLDPARGFWIIDPETVVESPFPLARPWPATGAGSQVGQRTATTYDASGRPLMAWADDERPHVAAWDGTAWTLLDDTLPRAVVRGTLGVAATAHRVCVAWSSESWLPTIFVRCHALGR